MKAHGGLSRDPAMLGTSGYALRPNGQYFTPTWVTEVLLSRVGFQGVIWEPAAGGGDMVKPLRVAGYRVFASELHGPDLMHGTSVKPRCRAKLRRCGAPRFSRGAFATGRCSVDCDKSALR